MAISLAAMPRVSNGGPEAPKTSKHYPKMRSERGREGRARESNLAPCP